MDTSNNIKDLQKSIEVLSVTLDEKSDQLVITRTALECLELDPCDFEESYIGCLDDCNGEFMGFSASDILKNCDPIAYRCGLLDYIDSIDKEETEEGMELLAQIESLESAIEDLEADIEAIEEEIEELEEEENEEI
jgi:hypothetical protein